MKYDVLIIGAGPGGIFSAYELMQRKPEWKVAVLEAGNPLEKRHCPIDGDKVKSCIHCKTCAIMNGFGGAGAFSDGKYNLTNEFGGTLYEYIGKQKAMELMRYVDEINVACGGAGTKLYSTADSGFKRLCLQNNLHLLDASVRHLGTGPGGIFSAYELMQRKPEWKVAVLEAGNPLEKRHCPIDGDKVKSCIHCKTCAIMNGFGGAGAFSDGKYNLTNEFGGTLYEYIGKQKAMELMRYVDEINVACGGAGTKLYSTADSGFKRLCLQNNLHLLDASVRHLGTDINYKVLENLYAQLKEHIDFHFLTPVKALTILDDGSYQAETDKGTFCGSKCIISVGRSGSKWMESVCEALDIPTKSNRVDIGVRVELPAEVFAPITDELYESKIVYKTEKYQDKVRTFCMNPRGAVVNENTNGIVTVNGHSYEDPTLHTENTNFALLVSKHFTEPFRDSNGYGESIARLSNMLGGGVMVQRFGDLIRGQRTTPKRIEKGFMTPTLAATPGDLSLVMPKRILDGIIEMIYALDKIAPGTASDDTLLYGVEVKFYNMEVALDQNLETPHKGLFVIGDGSGVTHSLSHASASGVYVARYLAEQA